MKKYTYEEVLNASLEYFNMDDLAAKVFVDKYALQNKNGEYLELTPKDMHKRLSKEFARIEAKYPNPMGEEEIFNLLDRYKFIVPQGSPMFGIGNDHYIQSLGNCFVVQSPYDSYGGICKTDQEMAQLMKRRAGVGLDVSNLRPKGLTTNNAAKTTDGIAIFMDRFSNTCREVAQLGRRGALMLSNHINHPEIETFINIKKDKKRVTGANISVRITDTFMKAVKNNGEHILQWPILSKEPIIVKAVKAKDIWNQIINCAWSSAEPGILFWDHIIDNSPADIYAKKYPNFETQSTNPCFHGNTLIAVADGRNAVSIKQLAEEGRDVPVYSINRETGLVEIKMGRHPRITGNNKQMVRVFLDDQSYVDTTLDHKFMLLNGDQVLAKDLKNGDSLPRFTKSLEPVKAGSKDYYRIYCNTKNQNENKIFEHRLIAKYYFPEEWNNIYTTAKQNGFVKTGGIVVHHKDYNQINNSPDNLQIMTFKDHSLLHGKIDNSGEKNGNYSGASLETIRHHALELTKMLGRRFSKREWVSYAKNLGSLPQTFSDFRNYQFGSLLELSKWCAAECNLEYIECDPRLVKTYKKILEQGYEARIYDHKVYVKKECELCHSIFEIEYLLREVSCCSQKCGASYAANNKMIDIKAQQARIYSALQFQLTRAPLMKEWELACKKENIPYRIGKTMKFGFHNFREVAGAGNNYNHKVVKVERLNELHTVYNITVDDNHTVGIITSITTKRGNNQYSGIFTLQCGELPLGLDSCRLLVINLLSFVSNPFTSKAKFDYILYNDVCKKAQRLMDDLVDLEIEKIEKIIKKIKADPEPELVKLVELNMWDQFLKSCIMGRRTGTGITALGDCLAALGIKYGSKKSIEITGEIYRQLMINTYKSSCIMAKERGAFPIFDKDMEKDHPFISHVLFQDKELEELYKANGRRNIALLTTAPTGSVSTQTQTTSGIEPAYRLQYKRRKKIMSSDKNARIDFTDPMGDKWQEFIVYHHGVKQWMKISGETDISKSPYHEATANDIDWMSSVDLQAAAQQHIDHSISKTCNLPSDATEELVSKVYMRAWESGCKGFTVYRDGCRTGVLIDANENKKDEDIKYNIAPKRPHELNCDIKKAKVNGEDWTFFVGLLKDKPYEMFGGLSKYVDIPNKYKSGQIIKNGKVDGVSTYNLTLGENEDKMTIKDIANVFENTVYGAFTRTISLALRHGASPQFVVEQLQKDKHSEITSFSKVMARVLKNYIEDGTKSTEKKCPECNKVDGLIYQSGCISCLCGYSKCG